MCAGAYPKLQQLLEDLQSLLVLLRGSAILTDDFPTPVDVIENNQLLYLGVGAPSVCPSLCPSLPLCLCTALKLFGPQSEIRFLCKLSFR